MNPRPRASYRVDTDWCVWLGDNARGAAVNLCLKVRQRQQVRELWGHSRIGAIGFEPAGCRRATTSSPFEAADNIQARRRPEVGMDVVMPVLLQAPHAF